MGMRMITDKSIMLSSFFDLLITDMPFRNFTLRFYARMLFDLAPNFTLTNDQGE